MNTMMQKFIEQLNKTIPSDRLIIDPLRTLAYGTDASFYRLIPKLVVKAETEIEVSNTIELAYKNKIPLTFRAAGTSLSGQAITDSVLVLTDVGWKGILISDDKTKISLQPGVIGSRANLELREFNKKIGPDPASINSAMIGGIAANNASGMCCGTSQNSYNTLASMKIIFTNGNKLDTSDEESVSNFRKAASSFIKSIEDLSKEVKADTELADRISQKFKMKNTTGYSLNALVDFEDPIDIIQHLMIGSEGTLGFISEITYHTVDDLPDRASSLIVFKNTHDACSAIPFLKRCQVDAVELMDRASLRSVEDKPGMPNYLSSLSPDATALLVETSSDSKEGLQSNIEEILNSISQYEFETKPEFTDIRSEYEKLWKIRKGLFPSVGAMRKSGTTVIIEDVCFKVDNLASATIELQQLFKKYNYNEAIIFGHALEGNLHFVFSQDFNSNSEVNRYSDFMDEVVRMVVDKYDGSLKAEHGTGRNMAPFVEKEWGAQAFNLMKRIKHTFDEFNILNPGVILNNDPKIHLKNLKPLPIANPIIDKCIECGFCEVNCPSKDVTLTPRQRIVGWREIQRLKLNGKEFNRLNQLIDEYNYFGDNTCATDGLCAISCPVDIDTGKLVKELRADKVSPTAKSIAAFIASHMTLVTSTARIGLNFVHYIQNILGNKALTLISNTFRNISGNSIPKWSPALPKGSKPIKLNNSLSENNLKVVYFPSCITRSMGVSQDYNSKYDTIEVTERLLKRAGYDIIYPTNINELCCGMAFNSKGFIKEGKEKADELLMALETASEKWKYPILFDMSPCLQRIKEYVSSKNGKFSGIKIYEQVEFIHDQLLNKLDIKQIDREIAIHITCSSTKMGLEQKFQKVAEACSKKVTIPKDVGCCGFAGDRGFSYPELNESALKDLRNEIPQNCSEGYSNSRTCEIGLTEQSGISYKSILYLVDEASS
jgi:D-lactate dehydrogenase